MTDSGTEGSVIVEVKLPKPIDRQLASEIEKQSVYVSSYIRHLKVGDHGDVVFATCDAAGPLLEETTSKIKRFVEAMTKNFRKIEQRVHHERDRHLTRANGTLVYEEFRRRGWAFEHGQGQVSLSGPPLNALNALDRQLADAYREKLDAVDHSYPAMIKAELLARCGYFEMHPNAVSFVSHAVEDFDELEAFRRANTGKLKLVIPGHSALALPEYCLNPAACFPCYEALEGRKIPEAGTTLTWRGRVFRFESRNITGLDRLWEFSVRELVFIGSEEFVLKGRAKAMELVIGLCEEWDLDCRIETATDPFFATVYAAKAFWQQAMDVKHEVLAKVEDTQEGNTRTIAVGSFNLHGGFFGNRFHIHDAGGGEAASGCVGFGLERLMFSLFAQHGLEAASWPVALRDAVFR
jgi:seryl-tRNA synthetase